MKSWNDNINWNEIIKSLDAFERKPIVDGDINKMPALEPIAEHIAYVIDKHIKKCCNPFDRLAAAGILLRLHGAFPNFMRMYVKNTSPVEHTITDDDWDKDSATSKLTDMAMRDVKNMKYKDMFNFLMHYFV